MYWVYYEFLKMFQFSFFKKLDVPNEDHVKRNQTYTVTGTKTPVLNK